MGNGKNTTIFLITLLFVVTATGCVSKSTYQDLDDHASKLDKELSQLQNRHNDLQKQQELLLQEKIGLENDKAALIQDKTSLENAQEVLTQEKSDLENANGILTKDKDALATGNKELEAILAAREDALSKKIAGLRQEMTNHVEECTRHLAGQSRQIDERNQQITKQTEQINTCASSLTATLAANQQLTQERQQLRAEKEAVAQQLGSTYQALIDKMKSEIDNGQITISELKGKLTVNLVDAILFDSGKAEIKAEGLLVLQKVVDILKEVSGKTIRIEGHTDNVKIVGVLAQRYPSNWELAAARAVNVARFLQDRGIDPHNLNAVAHGEYKPVAENDSEPGRARNRRIEIVLANQE